MRVRYSFSSRKTGTIDVTNRHRQGIPKVVKDLIRISDVVLFVLDARYIEDTRNLELEQLAKSENKRLIFILNKVDMMDEEVLKANPVLKELYPYVILSCKLRKGIRQLRDRIKIESKRALKEKKFEKAHIGVIGYPNAGKSSVINLLSGRGSAGISKEAGFTKGIQKIRLVKNIYLIDTPGVLPKEEEELSKQEASDKHAKVGISNYDKVKEPELVVASLFKDNLKLFKKHYQIETDDPEELIEIIGRRRCFLQKGNKINIDKTARTIVQDWQEGKIR